MDISSVYIVFALYKVHSIEAPHIGIVQCLYVRPADKHLSK